MAKNVKRIGRGSFNLVRPPNVIELVFFVFTLNDLQLVLDARFPEDRTLDERHKSDQGVEKMFTRHFEMEISVFGNREGI